MKSSRDLTTAGPAWSRQADPAYNQLMLINMDACDFESRRKPDNSGNCGDEVKRHAGKRESSNLALASQRPAIFLIFPYSGDAGSCSIMELSTVGGVIKASLEIDAA
ncbi:MULTISPECIES: hypothetical protein [Rhodopseudomonas]|uniref:hypothetical protein n=1 Tax=Rhodopseudomonas TaxID=1073 RepID=UPI00128BB7F2|nr:MULTISPECIES: hypothetical protein [Rhodopseudomonas]MDF3809927.1 hypothetical protein [Rhodopseudomonas sp. BAL398]WOK20513.1 hypothetical protein RBJ75_13755 [Rhodopseudomonas sp. BAL398]